MNVKHSFVDILSERTDKKNVFYYLFSFPRMYDDEIFMIPRIIATATG